jgi:hypothetical protein
VARRAGRRKAQGQGRTRIKIRNENTNKLEGARQTGRKSPSDEPKNCFVKGASVVLWPGGNGKGGRVTGGQRNEKERKGEDDGNGRRTGKKIRDKT